MNSTPAFQITCAEEEDFDNLPWPHSQVNKFIAIEVFKKKYWLTLELEGFSGEDSGYSAQLLTKQK